jgi:ADP-heptose:LPS heptosyltransferase
MKRLLTGLAARIWRRRSLTPDELLALRPARILLVRQHNQMGDMVCATPCFRAVAETWPDAEIALVTAPVNHQVVAHDPHLDRIFLFSQRLWRAPGRLVAFLAGLRRWRADLAIVLNSVSFSSTSAYLALWSGARYVVGGDSAPFGSRVAEAYSLRLPTSPELDRHAIEHSLAPLAAVGITTEDLATVVVPSPEQGTEADALIAELLPSGPFWALHPGAGKAQNVWPAERFAAVARAVADQGIPVLVLHGPADQDVVRAFEAALAASPTNAPVVVAPGLSVGTSAAVIARADRFLCNDTGVMHIAGAVGTPSVALFGPTDPDLWKPPGDGVVAVRAPSQRPDPRGPEFGWLETLAVEPVLAAWRALPDRPNERARGLPSAEERPREHRRERRKSSDRRY